MSKLGTTLSYCKVFHTTCIRNRNEEMQTVLNKPVYWDVSILEFSKMLVNQFWYDYLKPKYDEKSNMFYMNTYSFISYIKTNDI